MPEITTEPGSLARGALMDAQLPEWRYLHGVGPEPGGSLPRRCACGAYLGDQVGRCSGCRQKAEAKDAQAEA